MATATAIFVLALFGVVLGSFCNVIIDRLPFPLDEPDRFGDEWGVRPWREVLGGSSRCSSCGAPVRPFDNIPLVSWILLRGRCRTCSARIPAFHPVVEVLVSALWVLLWVGGGRGWEYLPAYVLVPLGVTISVIDLRTFIVPTKLVWPGFAMVVIAGVVAALAAGEPRWLLNGILGTVTLAGPLFVIWFVHPRGMGFGDVRLATMLGWSIGFAAATARVWGAVFAVLLSLLAASVIGLVVGIGAMGARGMKAKVPFGPPLVAGALLCVMVMERVRDWVGN